MASKFHMGLITALSVVFLFAGMAFAKTKQIYVDYSSMVGKSLKLAPGKYRIDVTKNAKTSELQFYNRYGHLVGQAPTEIVASSQKNSQTEVDYDKLSSNQEILTEISPRGWRENLFFNHPSTNQKTAKQ